MEKLRIHFSPKVLFSILLTIGVVMLILSARMPNYSETDEYKMLNKKYYTGVIDNDEFLNVFEKGNRVRTSLMDLGNGLTTLSVSVLLFLCFKGICRWSNFKNLLAMKKTTILISANSMLLLQILGTHFYYMFRAWRGDYPPFADNISIPIYYNTIFYLICIVPLNLFLFLTLKNSELQINIFVRCGRKDWKVISWQVLFWLSFILLMVFLVSSIIDGDQISVIVCLCFIYIFLSLRAGKMNFYNIMSASPPASTGATTDSPLSI